MSEENDLEVETSLEGNEAEEEAINPCPPEWLDNEDNALLRGDAIGDTVYTHRWILKCLFTITEALPKYLHQNEDLTNLDVKEGKESPEKTTEDVSSKDDCEGRNSLSNEKGNGCSRFQSDNGNIKLLELDSEVEEAACQLWDMTVEKEVSLHLLNLQEIDIFHLAALIFESCNAPRLTEVMVGVIANLCCEEESCSKLLGKDGNEVLLRTLHLAGSTSDVPTLCEVMRLIRLLLWHRINRTPNTTWASCPLLKLLCQENFRGILSFIIKNSLSDALISSVLDLLSNFLFVCLPETGFSVASLYSTQEIMTGLIDVLETKCYKLRKQVSDDREKILHFVITCLYAFIDTPGAKIIQELSSQPNSNLESILQSYIEYEGRVETLEELDSDVCDRLIRVVGLSQLIIPSVKLPSLIMTIGRLMSLLYGEAHQYSVTKVAGEGKSGSRFVVSENRKKKNGKNKSTEGKKRDQRAFSNPLIEDGGWMSPPNTSISESMSIDRNIASTLGDNTVPVLRSFSDNAVEYCSEKGNSTSASSKPEEVTSPTFLELPTHLMELKEILEDYCYQLLAFWWCSSKNPETKRRKETQSVILDILDQCHAHEVLYILKAVRRKDASLVPRLQEQIIDSGCHRRLVALLAYMYQ